MFVSIIHVIRPRLTDVGSNNGRLCIQRRRAMSLLVFSVGSVLIPVLNKSDQTTRVLVLQGSFALTLCLHSHFVKMVLNSEQMDVWIKT